MTQRYLVATDGERATRCLTEYISDRFDPGEATFLVICVADESRVVPYLMAEEAGTGGIDPGTIHGELENQAESIADEGVEFLKDAGYEAEPVVRFGNPGQEICDEARGEDVDQILVSRRSHTAVGELLLGSVSQYVIHHSDRPVTLIPLVEEES